MTVARNRPRPPGKVVVVSNRLPVRLVYQEPHPDRSSASKREAAIKKLSRSAKLALIRPR